MKSYDSNTMQNYNKIQKGQKKAKKSNSIHQKSTQRSPKKIYPQSRIIPNEMKKKPGATDYQEVKRKAIECTKIQRKISASEVVRIRYQPLR